jgi:hypothetical protein
MMRSDNTIFRVTVGGAEAIAGRELSDNEVSRIATALENTDIMDTFAEVVHRMTGNAD